MLQVAQVLKSNGVEGGLILSFRDFDPEDIQLQEPVFIEFDGLPVPFFFNSFTLRGNRRALVTLTGVRSLADAEELVGKAVFVDGYEEDEEEGILGWTLLDEDGNEAGTIRDFEDIPGNTCLVVETPGGEVLVPFHEDLFLGKDEENRTVRMIIPDGLL